MFDRQLSFGETEIQMMVRAIKHLFINELNMHDGTIRLRAQIMNVDFLYKLTRFSVTNSLGSDPTNLIRA